MSGLFIPVTLGDCTFSLLDKQEEMFRRKKHWEGIQNTHSFNPEESNFSYHFGIPFLLAVSSNVMFHVPVLLFAKVFFSIPWVHLTLFIGTYFLLGLITPSDSLKTYRPTLAKKQQLAYKLVLLGTIMGHLFYACTTPSPINVATMLVMIATSLLHTYNDKAFINHVKTTLKSLQDRPINAYAALTGIEDTREVKLETIKAVMKHSLFETAANIAITTLCAWASFQTGSWTPLHTGLKGSFAALFFLDMIAVSLGHFAKVLATRCALRSKQLEQVPQ